MIKNISTDVLVIGGGAAALRAAIESAASGVKVTLVDKGEFGDSGTSPNSLGGFATLFNKDDTPEKYFSDWLRCSGNICDQNLVWEAINHSIENVLELEAIGMEFIKDKNGDRNLYRGAGQSLARGLTARYHGGQGPGIISVLSREVKKRGVQVFDGIMITRLFKNRQAVTGAVGVSPAKDLLIFSAKSIVLAAGGANRIYPQTAYPIINPKYRTTGDGFNLAFEAGIPLVDMEFIQFRDSPPGGARYGGKYLNSRGERFMERYDPVALEKAPRYRMAEALYREISAGRGPIMWEVGGIRESELEMPIAKDALKRGKVEIVLDFQRILGGAHINDKTETNLPGLFAAGESSGGLHGADRMQGNAFLETQAFGANAGRNAARRAKSTASMKMDNQQIEDEEARLAAIKGKVNPVEVTEAVRNLMWEKVGIVRDDKNLSEAIDAFKKIRKEKVPNLSGNDIFAALEACNLLRTAEIVARAALTRTETRSSQIRNDYPATDDKNWKTHVCITKRGTGLSVSTMPVVVQSKPGSGK